MKLLFFDDFRLGVLRDDRVVDVSDLVRDIPATGPQDVIIGVISHFEDYRDALSRAALDRDGNPLQQVRVRPPLPKPSTIVCMAVNYMEDGTRSEPPPMNAFLKPPSSVIGDGDTMVLPDAPATVFEGEAELAVVIGRVSLQVPAGEAMSHVFGFTNLIDGSARGLGPKQNSFYQMKARYTFAPIGPFLVTKDEVVDPHNLQVRHWANGVLKQDYGTADMAHSISDCIEWVTAIHALEPGDILALGTNHRGLFPYQNGDEIQVEASGLGRLHLRVSDELRRTWGRETRREREEQGLEPPSPQLGGKYAHAIVAAETGR